MKLKERLSAFVKLNKTLRNLSSAEYTEIITKPRKIISGLMHPM